MNRNLNSGYGQAQAAGIPFTTGNVFFVDNASGANINAIDSLYTPLNGLVRRYATITLALAACVADHGDVIVLAPDFATALSAAELLAAETKGVAIVPAQSNKDGIVTVYTPDTAIAAASDKTIFTITGLVEVVQIIGKVGTVIETTANAALLKINPTAGADVDLCAALDITAAAAKSFLSITGTAANALVNTDSGAIVKQAVPIIVDAGVIELETAGDATGTVKWMLQYKPLETGARVFGN